MRRFIDGLIDLMYPRDPDKPDPTPMWAKLLVLGIFGAMITLAILAR